MPIIKSVITSTTGFQPVLVEFENGKVQPGEEKNLESGIYEEKDGTKFLGLTTNNMLYTGPLKDDELYNNFILIHNKKKDKMQMVQVDCCILAPRLNKTNKFLQNTPLLSRESNVSELQKQFGSKKSRRATEQRERLTMNIDTVKEQLEKTVTDYSPLLTWKLPSKKCMELKTIGLIPLEPGTVTIELSNATNHSLGDLSNMHCQMPSQVTQVHQMPQQTHCIEQQMESIMPMTSAPKEQKQSTKKRKTTVHKRFKKIPVDGMVYHSQQLGLKVPPKKSLGIRGMVIHSQAREVINNVFKFMKEEAQNGIKIPTSNYRERVLSATGISKCTYSRITAKEFKLGEPQPCRLKKRIKLDESVTEVTENDSIYRPKINRDASTRDGIYNLEDLVPGYILDTLAPEAGHILTTGNMQPYNFGPFVASSINKILMNEASEEIQIRRLTIFLYINYLIKFMTTPMKNVTKKTVVCDKSTDVNSHILDTFSVNSQHSRTRPLHMKDKAICYTLVLAAIAMEYEVNVEQLSKDLKIGVKKTLEVSRILAFNASKDKHIVQLKLPLPAPVSFSTKRKRL